VLTASASLVGAAVMVSSAALAARMPRDLTIRCGEEFYPDRGMHPLTNVPRANLALV
jgi:hypothetical protein